MHSRKQTETNFLPIAPGAAPAPSVMPWPERKALQDALWTWRALLDARAESAAVPIKVRSALMRVAINEHDHAVWS